MASLSSSDLVFCTTPWLVAAVLQYSLYLTINEVRGVVNLPKRVEGMFIRSDKRMCPAAEDCTWLWVAFWDFERLNWCYGFRIKHFWTLFAIIIVWKYVFWIFRFFFREWLNPYKVSLLIFHAVHLVRQRNAIGISWVFAEMPPRGWMKLIRNFRSHFSKKNFKIL